MTPSDAYEGRLVAAELPGMIAALAEKAQAAYERRLREWGSLVGNAPQQMCSRHPGRMLTQDIERSLFESDRAKQVTIAWNPCPDCEADALRQREERNLIRRGIPARSLGITLETWEPDWEPTKAAKRGEAWKAAQQWTQARPPVPFLIILGKECGTGKTALGVAALRAWSDIRCLDFRDWIDGLVAMDSSGRAGAIEGVRQYGALMIDDIGNRKVGARESGGGNAMERDALAAVLNWRFENRLPTILTSNLTPANFIQRFDPRTVDRIKAGRVFIDASEWPSKRAAEVGI